MNILNPTATAADAISRGYSVLREAEEDEAATVRKGHREWCQNNGVECVELYQSEDQSDWDICIDFPEGSELQEEVGEILERYGSELEDGSELQEKGLRVATAAPVPEAAAAGAVNELLELLGLPAQS